MSRGIHPSFRSVFVGFGLLFLCNCALPGIRGESPADRARHVSIKALIRRLASGSFSPAEGEQIYPFIYSFQKAVNGEVICKGEGFILLSGSLWCLVQRWQDSRSGNPGQRMLIVDRRRQKLEAEVRQWPAGSPEQQWNNWICVRLPDPADKAKDLYHCEYYYPEGTETVIQSPENWGFYGAFFWNEDGLLEKMTRFEHSYVYFHYEGFKLKRLEFESSGTITTFVDFLYD
jgi:hypothetical protein